MSEAVPPRAIRRARPEDHARLLAIWERSVRATDDFLGEADIAFYRTLVRDRALPRLEVWILTDGGGEPTGWMGLTGAKIEALFVAPEHHRGGGGRALVEHARARHGSLTCEVNEQNGRARRFYERLGFVVEGRSPLDGSGRPFPLLQLRSGPVAERGS